MSSEYFSESLLSANPEIGGHSLRVQPWCFSQSLPFAVGSLSLGELRQCVDTVTTCDDPGFGSIDA
jgi:hypothetical protein